MKNTNGLDAAYFKGKLALVVDGINNYTSPELARELARLAKTADDVAASAVSHPPAQPDTAALQARIAELEADAARLDAARHQANCDAQPTPMHEQNARFAIDGAIAFGMQGTNKPPAADHWLMEYWEIGQKLAAQAGQEPLSVQLARQALAERKAALPCFAPANSLAIVQAALEAMSNQLEAKRVTIKNDPSAKNALFDAVKDIRAIDPQTIIDGMTK